MHSAVNNSNDSILMVKPPSSPPESEFASTSSSSPPQQNGRRRSVSIAETHPSVETVMAKAKRAALSLWMLLHAQSCTLGQKCPHAGCQEAKLLHLHMKTCHTNADGQCPLSYHGCDQSRKLLAHHRRCKALRTKRHSPTSTSCSTRPTVAAATQHYCLVCSLVARQARTLLTTARATPSTSSNCIIATKASKKIVLTPRTPAPSFSLKQNGADSLSHLYEMAKQLEEQQDVRPRSVSDAAELGRPVIAERRPRSASVGGTVAVCTTITEESEGHR